jgi:hypothetical protein
MGSVMAPIGLRVADRKLVQADRRRGTPPARPNTDAGDTNPSAALRGAAMQIAREPKNRGNTELSEILRDAVIGVLLLPE